MWSQAQCISCFNVLLYYLVYKLLYFVYTRLQQFTNITIKLFNPSWYMFKNMWTKFWRFCNDYQLKVALVLSEMLKRFIWKDANGKCGNVIVNWWGFWHSLFLIHERKVDWESKMQCECWCVYTCVLSIICQFESSLLF